MNSLRRWLYRPKRSDPSLLAQFYFADEDLNLVAAELDSFEGRKDPERCTALVNQLRACQARVLNVISQMMDESVKGQRAPRDFRVKFPDDVIQENLAGQLWFGAECLAAGSSIMNREVESACMRPLARALTKNLDSLRSILREQCHKSVHDYTDLIKESLVIFDKLFAEFELSYVSAMVPVKTAHEYDMIQEVTVLFSETVQRALKVGLLTRDMIDEYDPALMFTIPRLAILSGVLIFKDGPLNPDNDPWNISEMFRPFQTLLLKIRELLGILTEEELNTLERALCSQEEPSFLISLEESKKRDAKEERRKSKEEKKAKSTSGKKCDKKEESEGDDGSVGSELTALEIAERLEALALNFEASRIAQRASASGEQQEVEPQSNESSSSSSTNLSEAGVEDTSISEVVKENASENPNDLQVQRFTNQLYYEANLDSQEASLVEPINAFVPDSVFLDSHLLNQLGDSSSAVSGEMSFSQPTFSEADGGEDMATESAAAGRTHFAMSKCDSNDSGLHSEVLSNSGSMFTISSSDSAQIFDAPVLSDTTCASVGDTSTSCVHSADGGNDSSEVPISMSEACRVHTGTCKSCGTRRDGDGDNPHTENGSSNTLVGGPSPDCGDKPCLISCSACGSGKPEGTDACDMSSDDDIMVSPMEEEAKVLGSICSSEVAQGSCEFGHVASIPDAASIEIPKLSSEMKLDSTCSDVVAVCLSQVHSDTTKTVMKCDDADESLISQHEKISSSHEVEDRLLSSVEGNVVPAEVCSSSLCSVQSESKSIQSVDNSDLRQMGGDNVSIQGLCVISVIDDSETKISVAAAAACDTESASNLSHSHMPDEELSLSQTPTVPLPEISDKENPTSSLTAGNTEILPSHGKCDVDVLSGAGGSSHSPGSGEDKSCSSQKPIESYLPSLPSSNSNSEMALGSASLPADASKPSDLAKVHGESHSASTASASVPYESPKVSPDTQAHSSSRTEILSNSCTTSTSTSAKATPEVTSTSARTGHRNSKRSSKSRVGPKKHSKSGGSGATKRSDVGDSASSASSRAKALMDTHLLDTEYCNSSETSSYNSDCGDQEEIALAIKAAENATRHQVRARFRSSSDMIHRLFVCISGVADQLQTNFAGDLRNILRAVFDMNCSEPMDISDGEKCKDTTPLGAAYRAMSSASRNSRRIRNASNHRQEPPSWIPDEQISECMSCQVPFTFVRRRHHCRNCGKIFCGRCSSNFVPLPHFGQERAVRVCNRCFMFRVTPFTVRTVAAQ